MNGRKSEDGDLERRIESHFASLAGHRWCLRRIEVAVDDRTATLHGAVRSYHEKQLIGHYCQCVPGVARVVNAVKVASVCMASSR